MAHITIEIYLLKICLQTSVTLVLDIADNTGVETNNRVCYGNFGQMVVVGGGDWVKSHHSSTSGGGLWAFP